jgi:hypothetical protein
MKTLFAFEHAECWYLTPQPADVPCRSGKVFQSRQELSKHHMSRRGSHRYRLVIETRDLTGKLVLQDCG